MKRIHHLLAGIAVVPFAAQAQELKSDSQEPAAADQAYSSPGTQDIVVTARRRSERLQDVPIAVQAFNEQKLQSRNIVRVDDLVNSTPSLKVANTSSGRTSPSYELRGISSLESLATQDAPVALYVNDVYVARPTGTNQQLFDIENVQVLLGPQGTLFGRNATAGAITISARKPGDKLEAEAHASYGNYDAVNFGGMVNVPVSDRLQIRVAGERSTRDGYTVDLNTGKDYDNLNEYALRAGVRWAPLHSVENILIVDHYRSDDNGSNNILVAGRPGQPASRLYPTFQTLLSQQKARGVRSVAYSADTFAHAKTWNVSNITTVNLTDTLVLKNIFGYHNVHTSVNNDLDGTTLSILEAAAEERSRTYSDELQLQGKAFDDRMTFIVGGFYFHEKANYFARSVTLVGFNPNNPGTTNTHAVNESYSVFAQATYDVPFLKGLAATAGARYSWDNRKADYDNPTVGVLARCRLTGLPAGSPCELTVEKSFRKPTWTLGLDYHIDPSKMVYIASRRGYRSGGFNPKAFSPREASPFQPETVTDVEIGFKGDWRIGSTRLRTNIAAYDMRYDQIQRSVTSIVDGVLTTTVVNAAKARIKGLEANVAFEPVHGFELSGYYGLVDAIHTRFDAVVNGVPTTLRNVPFGTARNSYGFTLALTPLDRENVARVTFTGSYNFQDSYFSPLQLPFFDAEAEIPKRQLVNFNLDFANIGGSRFSAQAFVKNAFNEKYVLGVTSVQSALGLTEFIYGEPRFYGVRLSYRFD